MKKLVLTVLMGVFVMTHTSHTKPYEIAMQNVAI